MLPFTALLYATFAAPRPARIDGCPCCIDRKSLGPLHTLALRDLTGEDLGAYASSLFHTVGAEADFRYFLPRIFELTAETPGAYPGAEIAFHKLALAHWETWPKAERAALAAYFDAAFDHSLAGQNLDPAALVPSAADAIAQTIAALLTGMGRAGVDLAPFLARLLAPEHAAVFLRLRHLWWDAKRQSLPKSHPFLDQHPTALAQMRAFMSEALDRLGPPEWPA